ncbi:hypothetical protein JCM3770_003460 [Rhodotorula araucariae]
MAALPSPSARNASSTPPEPFLLGILHLLLAPFASPLPPALLSQTTRQAIHYLSIAPDDETYWTCGRRDEGVSRRRRELIEAGNLDDLVISLPHFAFDLDETKCLITLSLPYAQTDHCLGVVLAWEDSTSPLAAATGGAPAPAPTQRTPGQISDDDVRPGWTFLELQALDAPPGRLTTVGPGGRRRPSWYPSLGEAVAAATSGLAGSLALPRSGAPRAEAEAVEKDGAREEERKKLRAALDMDDGEGTTPGAIGSAEDFWAGWSDDEKGTGGTAATAPREDDQDDAGYWDSYGGIDTQVGGEDDDDRDTVEALAPSSASHAAPVMRVHRASTVTQESAGLATAAASTAPRLAPSYSPAVPSPQQQPYFSNNLPPLSPSHFGLSPTQRETDDGRFSGHSGSQNSGDGSPRARVQPSPPVSPLRIAPSTPTRRTAPSLSYTATPPNHPPVTPTRSTFSLSRQAVSPSHQPTSPLGHPPSPHPPLSPQQGSFRQQASPNQKRGHLRQASDILKALPSFPAFPVVSRSRSNSRSAPSTPSAVAEPAGSHGANGGYFAPRSPQAYAEPPRSPAKKALPPAPAPPQQPATFAPQYANLIPVGAGGGRPLAPVASSAASPAHGRAPPPAAQYPPPPLPSSLAGSPARAAPQTRTAPRAEVARNGSLTSPLPSTAVFTSPSSPSAPPLPQFAPPAPPTPGPSAAAAAAAAEHAAEQVRVARLASVGSIGGLSIASTGFTGVLGELEAVNGRVAALFPLPPRTPTPTTAAGTADSTEDARAREESLAFAMAGLWGLFSAGAATGAHREERRRQWERVAGQVVRS